MNWRRLTVRLQTYLHNSGDGEFTPLDASTEEGKCILCVKTAVVQLPLEKEARTLLLTSASDGLCVVLAFEQMSLANPKLTLCIPEGLLFAI